MTFHCYVMFDANRRPVYVGQTSNLARRMREHERGSRWFSEVALICAIPAATRREAEALESDRINALRPRCNWRLASWRLSLEDAIKDYEWAESLGPELTPRERKREALLTLAGQRAAA